MNEGISWHSADVSIEASYTPVFTLRGHRGSVNHVAFHLPDREPAYEAAEGIFSSPLTVSCDTDGYVWIWDLELRKSILSFHPARSADAIKRSRLFSELEAGNLTDQPFSVNADDGSSGPALNGVLWAEILNLRVGITGSDDMALELPVLATQCRNQRLYFWSIEVCESDETLDADCAFANLAEDGSSAKIHLLHETTIPQLGFCPSVVVMCRQPSIQNASQSVLAATPEDNTGKFTFHRFHLTLNSDLDKLQVHVESQYSTLITDVKCGQAMCATSCVQATKTFLVFGFESGHLVVFDTDTFQTIHTLKLFPDPVTCARLQMAGGSTRVIAGSAEGTLQALRVSESEVKVLWSYKANKGLGAITASEDAVAIAGWDGQIRVLDIVSGLMVTNLVHHQGSVSTLTPLTTTSNRFSFSLSSNSKQRGTQSICFASAGADKVISVWLLEW